jgi:hypothetical protein
MEGQQALATTQGALDTFDNLIKMTDKQPGLSFFGGAGNATGGIMGRIPNLLDNTIEYQELLNLAKDKVFLAQLPAMAGKGALSDAEGEALRNSLVSLSSTQRAEVLKKNFKVAYKYLTQIKKNLSEQYGIPAGDATPPSDGKLVFVRGPDGKIIQQPAGTK